MFFPCRNEVKLKMEQYTVQPIIQEQIIKRSITVEVPGSKSITNRALLLATLAEGESTLRGALFSDDSRYFMKCVRALGFQTTIDEEKRVITLTGDRFGIPNREAEIYVGSAGTAARFLTALLGISGGTYFLDA